MDKLGVARKALERGKSEPRLRQCEALRLDLKPPMPSDRCRLKPVGPNLRDQGDEVESVMQREAA